MMTCTEFDSLLCDYLDHTLSPADSHRVEVHSGECPHCAALLRDCSGALSFLERAPAVEPPPAAVTRILQQIPARQHPAERARGWFASFAGRWFAPVLQPRMVMGMAMTILSFAMLGRFAGIEARQVRPADLQPARVVEAAEDRFHRMWNQAIKYYDNLRLVYEIQWRLRELTADEDAASGTAPAARGDNPPAQGEPKP